MRCSASLLAVALIALATCISVADNPAADLVEIRGTVLDESGQPASGATVTAIIEPVDPPTAKTDAAGRFALKLDRQRANYLHLLASAEGGRRQAMFIRDQKKPQPLDAVELTLGKTRQIEVVVVDDKQQPVAGAETGALLYHTRTTQQQTDAQGRANLLVPAAAPLTYVYALKPHAGLDYVYFRQPEQSDDNPHWLKQDHDQPVTLTLRGVQPIAYRMVDDKEKPLPGVRVYPTYLDLPQKGQPLVADWMTVVTGNDGLARFTAMPLGIQQPVPFLAKKQHYYCDERLLFDPANKAIETTARLAPQVPLRGQVVAAAGAPAAGAQVTIVGDGYGPDSFHGTAICDEAGLFETYVDNEKAYAVVAELNKQCSGARLFVVAADRPAKPLKIVLEPATRVFGTLRSTTDGQPLAGAYISLQLLASDAYHKLPKHEQLPEKDSPHGIYFVLDRRGRTDEEGRFECLAGKGSYGIHAGGARAFPKLAGERELELNLQATPRIEKTELQGRVVLATSDKQSLEGIHVRGLGVGNPHNPFECATDATGAFTVMRDAIPARLFARSKDGLLAGWSDLKATDRFATIAMHPTASATGRLVDELRGEPLSDRDLQYGIRITRSVGDLEWHVVDFGGSVKTDAEGKFTITGLAIDAEYDLQAVSERDDLGMAESTEDILKFKPKESKSIRLGDVTLPSVPTGVTNWIDRSTPPTSEAPLEKRLKTKLRDAVLAEQQLLVIVAPKKSDICRRFAACYLGYDGLRPVTEAERQKSYRALQNFSLLTVDTTPGKPLEAAQALLKPLRIPLPEEDAGTFAILDQEGKLVAAAASGDLLDEDERLDTDKLLDFVSKHTRALPDAEKLFENALAQAKRDDKRVLVQVSGAFCAPCVLLSRYLDEHKELIAKDYVVVKLDDRFVSGEETIKRVRSDANKGGVPWTVILDSAGQELATSTAKSGNIGFPSTPEGIEHFQKMLTSTAQRLTAEEIGKLVEALGSREKE
jgi:hypothetical protein